MDDKRTEPDSPFDADRIFATVDAGLRNSLALIILIGGSVALAIWVSPWFCFLPAAVVVLVVVLLSARGRGREGLDAP